MRMKSKARYLLLRWFLQLALFKELLLASCVCNMILTDMLVCFARPTFLKKGASRTESSTPRSLSALAAYITNVLPQISGAVPTSPKYNYSYPTVSPSPSTDHNISISNYYYQDKVRSNTWCMKVVVQCNVCWGSAYGWGSKQTMAS